jgi:hypothetical protein
MTPTCTALAKALYSASVETVVEVSSPKVAEMVKLLENTFRAVNIGLVNELALMCDRLGISVWEVVEAAATKPFGFMPFYPGPGLGGHCIPIDPFYLSWKVKEVGFEARFIELAGQVNGSMPSPRRAEGGRRVEHGEQGRAGIAHSGPWASRTNATSMTTASRRRSTSWPISFTGARSSATTIRMSPKWRHVTGRWAAR